MISETKRQTLIGLLEDYARHRVDVVVELEVGNPAEAERAEADAATVKRAFIGVLDNPNI